MTYKRRRHNFTIIKLSRELYRKRNSEMVKTKLCNPNPLTVSKKLIKQETHGDRFKPVAPIINRKFLRNSTGIKHTNQNKSFAKLFTLLLKHFRVVLSLQLTKKNVCVKTIELAD